MNSRNRFLLIRRIARRFEVTKPYRGFAYGKLWLDPAFEELARRLEGDERPLLDLGCGLGLLGFYLRERGCRFAVHALDTDARKIEAGRKVAAAAYPEVTLEVGDIRHPPEFRGNVAILDVVHYFPDAQRTACLVAAAERVPPGGRLFVRTALRDASWRYWITYAEDVLTRSLGWINGVDELNFPTARELAEPVEALGFTCSQQPLWGVTPFNSYLFEFRRNS